MQTGVVIEFDEVKGFGSIENQKSGTFIYVHHSAIMSPEKRKSLKKGDLVQFKTSHSCKGLIAINVRKKQQEG